MELQQQIRSAAEYILSRVAYRPTVGMVLGSGLGDFADTLEDAVRIPFAEIPGFPLPTVPGHTGALVTQVSDEASSRGLLVEDVILSCNGEKINNPGDFPETVDWNSCKLILLRKQKAMEL